MRDDIHKRVPRPYRVQQWVKRSVNDADRLSGRSLTALNEAVLGTCRREVSELFLRGLVQELQSPPGLFGLLSDIRSPRDLGSNGGHFEAEILSEAKRLLAKGSSPETVHARALAGALDARIQADIRATAPVLLATHDPKAKVVLDHMQSDAAAIDCGQLARDIFGGGLRGVARAARPRIDANEDLRGAPSSQGRL